MKDPRYVLAESGIAGGLEVHGDLVGSVVDLLEGALHRWQSSVVLTATALGIVAVQNAGVDQLAASGLPNAAGLLVLHSLAADDGGLVAAQGALVSRAPAGREVAVGAGERAAKQTGKGKRAMPLSQINTVKTGHKTTH